MNARAASRSGYVASDDLAVWSWEESFETREDAARAAMARWPGRVVYTGLEVPPDVNCLDGLLVLEDLDERVRGEVGEAADGWIEFTLEEADELGALLNQTLRRWLRRRGKFPRGMTVVDDVEEHGPGEAVCKLSSVPRPAAAESGGDCGL